MKQKSKIKKSPTKHESEGIRLNKFLADAGVCSRRKADELIEDGIVRVNGKVVTELGTKVDYSDSVTVDGEPIQENVRQVYIILNKPKDFITTTSDELDRKTVMDIVRVRARVYPVGRLDRNTTGALLITNDGELANRLMHPKYEIQKSYTVLLDDELRPDDAKRISEGVELEDGFTAPCEVFIYPDNKRKTLVTLHEGRNREVRRIFESFGYTVKSLDRKFYAGLSVRGLKRGEYRHLTRQEVADLKKLVGIKRW